MSQPQAPVAPNVDDLYKAQFSQNLGNRTQNFLMEANHWQAQFEVSQHLLAQAQANVKALEEENSVLKVTIEELKIAAGIYGPEQPAE